MWSSLKRRRQADRNRIEIRAGPCPMVSQQLIAVRWDEVTPRASQAKSLSARSGVVLLNFGSIKPEIQFEVWYLIWENPRYQFLLTWKKLILSENWNWFSFLQVFFFFFFAQANPIGLHWWMHFISANQMLWFKHTRDRLFSTIQTFKSFNHPQHTSLPEFPLWWDSSVAALPL